MDTSTLMQKDKEYICGTYSRFNLAVSHGESSTCWDFDGKKYIDFSSGIGVNSLGYAHKNWVNAVAEQAGKIPHMSNLYYTQPDADLAQKLVDRTGMKKIFFANSGAEANEGAIKAARKYSQDKYSAERYEIITLENSFHGRTITTLAATGQEVFHSKFNPLTEGFTHTPANDITALENNLTAKTCAVMLELVQGEGGVNPLEGDFVEKVADICAERDILLIVDEVQTGMGRTGKLLCCEHFNLKPDIITLAKGLGGGLPVGAVLFGDKTANTLGISDHATTFGGNPVVCAGANVVMDTLTDELLAEVAKKGEYITNELLALEEVESVSGKGLMLGITLKNSKDSRTVAENAIKNGVIVLTAKEKIRLLPPLTIGWDEIETGLKSLKQAINESGKTK